MFLWKLDGISLENDRCRQPGLCAPVRQPAEKTRLANACQHVDLASLLAVGVTACSGGNGTACTNNPVAGTTAGAYTITITGVSGTIKATQTPTLAVQ